MKFRPMGDFVLVKKEKVDEKTKGGIYRPEVARGNSQFGIVVEVGPGFEREGGGRSEMLVKAGDRVIFGKYAGSGVECDGEEAFFLRYDDIFSVIED